MSLKPHKPEPSFDWKDDECAGIKCGCGEELTISISHPTRCPKCERIYQLYQVTAIQERSPDSVFQSSSDPKTGCDENISGHCYRGDTTLIMNDILQELREIRRLLEWDKADTLEMRRQAEERKEQDIAEMKALQDRMGEIAYQRQLEAQRQANAEHERRYHNKGGKLGA